MKQLQKNMADESGVNNRIYKAKRWLQEEFRKYTNKRKPCQPGREWQSFHMAVVEI